MNKRKVIVLACVLFVGGYMVGDRNGKQKKVKRVWSRSQDLGFVALWSVTRKGT